MMSQSKKCSVLLYYIPDLIPWTYWDIEDVVSPSTDYNFR